MIIAFTIVDVVLAAVSIGCLPAIVHYARQAERHRRRAEEARDSIKRMRGIVP